MSPQGLVATGQVRSGAARPRSIGAPRTYAFALRGRGNLIQWLVPGTPENRRFTSRKAGSTFSGIAISLFL